LSSSVNTLVSYGVGLAGVRYTSGIGEAAYTIGPINTT
jgi:hypothetical protein